MDVRQTAIAARAAGRQLAQISTEVRTALLNELASLLSDPDQRAGVMEANRRDVAAAEEAHQRGELGAALVKRLVLDDAKLDGLADGMRQLAAMPEVIGERQIHRELDDGLVLERISCPLGLIGVVFESRPDAVPQISGLCLKSGNAVLLKGGKEALESNRALVELLREGLKRHDLDPAAIGLLEDRSQVDAMLKLHDVIDLVVARGGSAFVRHVMDNSKIEVLGHAEGLCHLYLDASADPQMSARIAVDAKTSYPAACNAIETLLWHGDATEALDSTVEALREAGVELRGDDASRERHAFLAPVTQSDWDEEYGEPVLALKRVTDMEAALRHIERHGSRHTETIVTADDANAERFIASVDAAGVFHNASSRFADGYRYGLGAEVGISTGKLHARGPVGIEGLVTYRWLLRGHGQVSADYGPGAKPYLHRDL